MLQFMDYVQNAFLETTGWNTDNSYANLNATARALLDFPTPRGLRMNLSSLSSPTFATSYSIGSLGVVDGSVSYLYSSLPLADAVRSSAAVDLHKVALGYRQLQELRRPDEPSDWEVWRAGERVDAKRTLLYGRMYLPASTLEGLYLRRLSPTQQIRVTAVSDARLKHGGTILAMHQRDVGKYSTELLYSTDVALIGARGLYNFGRDPRKTPPPSSSPGSDKPVGRFTAGAELYYGVLNKSAGMSTGFRYATLPTHPGIPLTMTLTLNPLMGHLTATYAVRASPSAAFCSRFDFNFYSYESDVVLGCELWQRRRSPTPPSSPISPSFPPSISSPSSSSSAAAASIASASGSADFLGLSGQETEAENAIAAAKREQEQDQDIKDDFAGVLKAKFTQRKGLGLLWEGRLKHLLFSVGGFIDFRRREQPVRAVGLEVVYSS